MPEQPELDNLLSQMLAAQGYKDEARRNIMLLTDAHKWQLLQSYQQSLVAASGDIRSQPEHWINVLNIEPSITNLQELSVLLRQSSVRCPPPSSPSLSSFPFFPSLLLGVPSLDPARCLVRRRALRNRLRVSPTAAPIAIPLHLPRGIHRCAG